ncbi:MAG: RICIN domain-containing protein [Prevotellaceae bacterium]|jgi:hypothetical protein|nr:RICIN domain-containing protein [Prevotellaceae bacterium]
MYKYVIAFFLFAGVAGANAQPLSRTEGSPYPASAAPDKLYLTSESWSYSQKVALQSLQGMLARTKPEILRDMHDHAAVVGSVVPLDRTYYSNFSALLARYANRFDGYILCKARTSSVNVAFSLCPILNAIAIPEDIEQTAKSAGYTLKLDVRGKDEAWALDNYGDDMSKTIASYQAANDDRALHLGDYSVFAGALQFWDDKADGTLARRVYSRMNPCAVYFGWGAGEYNTVEQLSQRSAMIHPSDWSPNLSTLSNIPAKIPRQKAPPAGYKVTPNVHTVCFVISDGDNIQWLSGSLNNANNWANPDKSRLKLGWTVSPAFAELAPVLYKKYVENALTTEGARNLLIAGPSGAGYYFPSIYPKLAEQTKWMNKLLKKADLNIVNIIDKDGSHNPNEYLKQSNVDALFYYSYGGQYTGVKGQIKWYKDKPSIGGRFTLWGNSDDGSAATRNRVAQNLANTLNSQSTDIHSAAGYSLVPVHIWTMNPSDVLNCIGKLNANVRVVSPDEFVWLVRKNVGKVDLANGNGLRAEYALLSNPASPVLTTIEPTVDYDGDYLTEGTQAVGDESFLARWTGKVQALYSQRYTFHTKAAGGATLKINGRTLCDSLENASVNSSDTITLVAGRRYDLELTYKKTTGKGFVSLEWESSSQALQPIPRYQLFSRPTSSVGMVTAFDSVGYGGYSAGLKAGRYSALDLESEGFTPGTVKSLKVTQGLKVMLYSGDSFTGDSLVVESDNAHLGAWQTRVNSMKISVSEIDLPEEAYHIRLLNGDNVMGVGGGVADSYENGKPVKLACNTGDVNLQFRLVALGDGVYRIESVSSGKSLEVNNFSKDDGAALLQWTTSVDADNQKFILLPAENGAYRIMSYHSGKIIMSATSSTLASVVQSSDASSPNALWLLEPVQPLLNGTGDGLTAEYYNGKGFNTMKARQIDTIVSFNWREGKIHPECDADNVSVRWQGKIEPRTTGEYTFYVNSDNGRRLWVNNQLIIDKWLDDYDVEYSGVITLQAGRFYDVKLEYFESNGGAYCHLEWSSPRQPREIIPRSQLYSVGNSAGAGENLIACGTGDGLAAEYYNGLEFNTLRAVQVDTTISFSWPKGQVHQSCNVSDISVRWQGKIEPRDSGEYTFFVSCDNGGRRLWINDRLIVNRWIDGFNEESQGKITLHAGELYDIKIEYFKGAGNAYFRLEWQSMHQFRQVVPRSQLYSIGYSGVESRTAAGELTIYPNPAPQGGLVNVETGDIRLSGEAVLRIYDITGRIVLSQYLKPDDRQVDISAIPKGIYFVALTDKGHATVKRMIVK